jgi:hypothetical protein
VQSTLSEAAEAKVSDDENHSGKGKGKKKGKKDD